MNNKVKIDKYSETIKKISLTDKQRKLISDLFIEMKDLQDVLASSASINYNTFIMPLLLLEGESSSLIEGTRTMVEDFVYDMEEMDNIPQWETRNLLNLYNKYIVDNYYFENFNFSSYSIANMHLDLYNNDPNSKFKMTFDTTKEIQRVKPGVIMSDDAAPNFIGPTNKIEDASLILLEPSKKEAYLNDLIKELGTKYKNKELLIDHIVLMHPIFEAIHPFKDGNGRIGRLLLAFSFKLTLGARQFPIFISEEFENNKEMYQEKLRNVQLNNDYDSWNDWNSYFIDCLINSKRTLEYRTNKILDLWNSLQNTKACSTKIRTKILSLFFENIKLNKDITIKTLSLSFPNVSTQTLYNDWNIVIKELEAETMDKKYYTNVKLLKIIRDKTKKTHY